MLRSANVGPDARANNSRTDARTNNSRTDARTNNGRADTNSNIDAFRCPDRSAQHSPIGSPH